MLNLFFKPCSASAGAMDGSDFMMHARLFGGPLRREDDLFPSTVIGVLFLLLAAGIVWRWHRAEKGFRPGFLLVAAVGMFANGLSFIIRAGASNTSTAHLPVGAIVASQIMLVIGTALMVDTAVVIARDMLLLAQVAHSFSKQMIFTLVVHVLLFISVILAFVAFTQVTTTSIDQPLNHAVNRERFWAAFLQFLALTFSILWLGILSVLFYQPWLIDAMVNLTALIRIAIAVTMLWFMWVPVLYMFVVIAVADDASPLVTKKLFFYLASGFFMGLVAVTLVAIDFHRYFPYLHPYLALHRTV